MKIGIYGGTFEPVHLGHIKLADYALSALSLDKLLIVPTYISPFKSEKNSSSEDVLNMCRLAFTGEKYSVLSIENDRKGKSYTVDTVNEIKELYGKNEYFLIIGSDQLLKFNKWYRFRDILQSVTLCAVARSQSEDFGVLCDFAEKEICPFGNCLVLPFAPLDISSTVIRERIADGLDVSDMVSPDVGQYITDRGLYR